MRRLAFAVLFSPLALLAADPVQTTPPLPDGSAKAKQHMAGFRLPQGLKVELFASEPMLSSPVAISVDDKGRIFVAEEYRLGHGAGENRSNPAFDFSFWLKDELQLKSNDDRLKMYEKWAAKFPGGMKWFTSHADQLRLVEDTTGSGRADKSSVFATEFNHPLDGLAAGVLAHDGDVYFTCIPNLWKFRDKDGKAENKTALLSGFGVNCAFYGHDLHGLIMGPDGKLYFSIGDRGFNVNSKEGKNFQGLRTGAVFRCDPDGSNFEVVMKGLRNPQELAFDQFGNLFADDNNCDKGDHARLVYIVEGGDSGWNMAYQTIPAPYTAGPWFAEKMWHLPHAGQPAWLVPPVGKIGTGPSGFLFTSGTTLPKRYENSFIMCNYAGGRGLEAFKVKPKGAGFEIEDYHDFLTPIMATDAEFGPDGKLYVSDFVNLDWGGKSLGGRLYTVFDQEKINSDEAQRVKKLFAEGFDKQPARELEKLLGHADQKVRMRAQQTLVKMVKANPGKEAGTFGMYALGFAAAKDKPLLGRLHAIWGLAQVAKHDATAIAELNKHQDDAEAEVRAQIAKVFGDMKHAAAAGKLVELLADANPRVKFFAAQSLGKLGHKPAVEPLFKVIAANNDADPWLRHACVAALAKINDADAVNKHASDANASVRLAVVLVQRRTADKRVAQFLNDPDPLVKAEAARAIHDLPMDDLFPQLAAILPKLTSAADPDATVRRAIDAAFKLGTADHAKLVLGAASNPNLSTAVRAEAVSALKEWSDPLQRDRVIGFWRPVEKRDPKIVQGIVSPGFEKLLGSASGPLLTDVVGLIGPLKLEVSDATLGDWVADAKKAVTIRTAALRVLVDRKSKLVPASVGVALKDASPVLKAEARDVLVATEPMKAATLLGEVLDSKTATTLERQRALAGLARVKGPVKLPFGRTVTMMPPAAGKLLDSWAAKLAGDEVPAELRLDVLDALKAAPGAARDKFRSKFEASLKSPFAVSLTGGDAERGKEIFNGHAAAQCVRCHVVKGVGGAAGPDLTEVAKRNSEKTREHFLESLLTPSAKLTPGFGTVSVVLVDGRSVSGVILKEDKKTIELQHGDGKKESIPVEDVERRSGALSPMPAVDKTLTPREVRDLIEYLSTLK